MFLCPFSLALIGECFENDYRLVDQSYIDSTSSNDYVIGTLEICVNGTYYPSCVDFLPKSICSSNLYFYDTCKLRKACSSKCKKRESTFLVWKFEHMEKVLFYWTGKSLSLNMYIQASVFIYCTHVMHALSLYVYIIN